MAFIISALRRGPISRTSNARAAQAVASPTAMLAPLAMAQFLASYDSSSMNVAISNIAADLDTTVTGVQTAITFFTLTMAALMITGSKLSDIWGRKRCFVIGIWTYGLGAFITAFAPSIGFMIVGFSLLEGIGSALMIPPIYILITVSFDDLKSRAKAFGLISAMAGLGAAAGPLIGGTITTAITWRASFAAEVVVVGIIWWLSRTRIPDVPGDSKRRLDVLGAILSAAALTLIVLGILQASTYGWFRSRQDFTIGDFVLLDEGSISPVWLFVGLGMLLLVWFGFHIARFERKGREPLIAMRLLKNRVSNLGLVTQVAQWFMIVGGAFVISVFLQVTHEYSAIQTGIVLTPTTAGVLLASALAGRFARKRSQRMLIRSGFVAALCGIALLVLMVGAEADPWALAPGLFLLGIGIGVMLTPSVNVVQTSFRDEEQGEISGVSRSVSNLGSSLGVAIAGSVLISVLIFGATDRAEDSTVLSEGEKSELSAALEDQVTTLSDTQVREALEGRPNAVVEEVTRINHEARDSAIAAALMSIGVAGVIGLAASMLLPREDKQASGEGS